MEYIGAMERHIAALKDGEWFTNDGMAPPLTHLGCINANTAIVNSIERQRRLHISLPSVE